MTPIEIEYLKLTGSALVYLTIARMITWVLYGKVYRKNNPNITDIPIKQELSL